MNVDKLTEERRDAARTVIEALQAANSAIEDACANGLRVRVEVIQWHDDFPSEARPKLTGSVELPVVDLQ